MDRVKAVFDGKVLVLQEPVDWPAGTEVEVSPSEPNAEEMAWMTPEDAFAWLVNNPFKGGGAEFDRSDVY